MKVERPRARSSAAPTRLNRRSTTPIWAASRRHEGADLGQHGDQRVLAQEGRFAGHVGAGDAARGRWRRRPRSQSLATKRAGLAARERLLDHRMAAAVDVEGEAVVDQSGGSSRPRPRARRAPRRRRAAASAAAAAAIASAARRRPRRPARRRRRARWPAPGRRRWRSCCSSSASSAVVKRMALAMVWRWMKRASPLRSACSRMGRRRPRCNSRARCCGGS